jgi:hypothetical protein
MARLARVIALEVAHHVTQRGNARQFILNCDAEREVYLSLLRETWGQTGRFPAGKTWKPGDGNLGNLGTDGMFPGRWPLQKITHSQRTMANRERSGSWSLN